eukprot:CAMPEP_0171366170 /NCGR_PEP_ID=MMETSP0879-20121228/5193_1 /TAXON_ID=67004 /ORGANISM="Thalassiosira weissflogii, Strain CCMP1336" /LENGTH=717 /DNA_ID=CAMNT_0011873907 /DNA_START=31 /DNA_END=2180 /DNA_ORIENTATION=+
MLTRNGDGKDVTTASHHSVAFVGSSGGGTATLGHTDPIDVLATVHRELLRIRDANCEEASENKNERSKRSLGLGNAIFVSLHDGSGLDSVKKADWMPRKEGDDVNVERGPMATLYAVGFHDIGGEGNENEGGVLHITKVARGHLSEINRRVKYLDEKLADRIEHRRNNDNNNNISAIISMSSEPIVLHASSFSAASSPDVYIPVTGSGGTSLSQIASLYDLHIVGNSGGSVASTTLTKAKGWAVGLAKEWGMRYDGSCDPRFDVRLNDLCDVGSSAMTVSTSLDRNGSDVVIQESIMPTLKSILEAALPSFLLVSVSLRFMDTIRNGANGCIEGTYDNSDIICTQQTTFSIVEYALRHIVHGTTCCILAATSRRGKQSNASSTDNNNSFGDQSTILLAASLAGIITSASASQASDSLSENGGSAMTGLIAGSLIPPTMKFVSNICSRFHVTATMTNILLGGGVGVLVGGFMHLSGLALGFGSLTGVIRSLMRWKMVEMGNYTATEHSMFLLPQIWIHRVIRGVSGLIASIQRHLCQISASQGSYFYYSSAVSPTTNFDWVPVPIGLGFLHGCFMVYGSKIGMYHSLFLPLILLEMDSAGGKESASILGAMDECALVMVCAGICAANLIASPYARGERGSEGGGRESLSRQALKTNLFCGDFIEAAYPYMEKSKIINGSSYLAAGLSSEILLQRRVLSTAYLPLPLAIWISNDRLGMG